MSLQICENSEPIPGYRLLRVLGRGGFGEVWEAEVPGGIRKAVKIAALESVPGTLRQRELEGMIKVRAIRHPYLLSLERFEEVDDHLIIVMELAEKSLADRFNECRREGLCGIPRDELLTYVREAAEVLDLMNHQHGLQHLDIKPENLFISGGHIKVADFGLVHQGGTVLSERSIALSPPYAPPEMFEGRVENTADQYSLAVTYQELLTGERPYAGEDVRSLIYQHLNARPNVSMLPPLERAIVLRAIQRQPEERYPNCLALVKAIEQTQSVRIGGSRPGAPRPRTLVRNGDAAENHQPIPGSNSPTMVSQPFIDQPRPSKPRFVRHRPDLVIEHGNTRGNLPTVAADTRATNATQAVLTRAADPKGEPNNSTCFRDTFVAYLPNELFVAKLRGFIDDQKAQLLDVASDRPDQIVIRIPYARKGLGKWFGFGQKSLFLRLGNCPLGMDVANRVIEIEITSDDTTLIGHELEAQGRQLVATLQSFLLASNIREATDKWNAARKRAELFS